MDIPIPIASALIAAIVSIAGGFLTYLATSRTLASQQRLQERQLGRRLTERLYELRLEAYPRAFEITDKLRGEYIFSPDLGREHLLKVLEELYEWHRTKAGFVLSNDSTKAWYAIRGTLSMKPDAGNDFSEERRGAIWEAKNRFRGALRADVNLLYVEELLPNEHQ